VRSSRERRDHLIAVVGDAEVAGQSAEVTDVAGAFRGSVKAADLINVVRDAYQNRMPQVKWNLAIPGTGEPSCPVARICPTLPSRSSFAVTEAAASGGPHGLEVGKMAKTVADGLWEMLVAAGVRRCYGIVGDALNPVIDALRRNGSVDFVHVRQ